METLAQGAVFVGITQLPEQTANILRRSSGLLDQRQGGNERESPRLRVLEQLAFERAALPRAVRVKPARAILAQGRAWLGKASDGRLAAGKSNRQPERFQLPGIIALLEFDEIEERTVAAKAARATELFAWFHGPTIRPEVRRWQGGETDLGRPRIRPATCHFGLID